MISIITCSIDKSQYSIFQENILATCGVPVEIFCHDNREKNWGLSKVYNYYANLAKYEILCFAHEDILFQTENWGKEIFNFYAANQEAGVVGFAGSILKTKSLSSLDIYSQLNRYNYIQGGYENGRMKKYTQNPNNELYSQVICLDGFCLFVPKKVWAEFTFREQLFDGFHLYDLSFTTDVATKYKNYVCHTLRVVHLSRGSFSSNWYKYAKLYHEKMGNLLPLYSTSVSVSFANKCECRASYLFSKRDYLAKWTGRSRIQILSELYEETGSIFFVSKLAYFILSDSLKRRVFKMSWG
ncbi:MAG: glycosyltransferase [Phocaeicola sp.]